MEANQIHRGRLLDHLQLVVRDLAASKRFYMSTFRVLGRELGGEGDDYFWCDELFVSVPSSPSAQGQLTGRMHLAFQAPDRETIDRWYRVGLENGGTDNGAPGVRAYHPGYYAAFLLDPDGNNIEAVFHGPSRRSAESVVIDF